MGYYYKVEPENAVPPKSCASPKTHVPGSAVKERGHRFYMSEVGKWTSRDPLGDVPNFIKKMAEWALIRDKQNRNITTPFSFWMFDPYNNASTNEVVGAFRGTLQNEYRFGNGDPLCGFDADGELWWVWYVVGGVLVGVEVYHQVIEPFYTHHKPHVTPHEPELPGEQPEPRTKPWRNPETDPGLRECQRTGRTRR